MERLGVFYILLFLVYVVKSDHTISVSGEGHVSTLPDECSISFGIEIFNESLESAQAQSESLSQQLIKVVKELGIQDQHLHTDQVRLTIERDFHNKLHEHGKGVVVGFTLRRAFNAVLRNLTQVEKFVSTITQNGANEINSINFRSSKVKELKDQARIKAVRAAKEKAELYASELGVKVGKPLQVSENDVGIPMFHTRALDFGDRGFGGSAPSYEGTVPIGNIEISASVSIVFEIDSSSFVSCSSFSSNPPNSAKIHECDDIQQSLIP